MAIYNKRYTLKTKAAPEELLDEIDTYFRLSLKHNEGVLRFAIVDASAGKIVIDATIVEDIQFA